MISRNKGHKSHTVTRSLALVVFVCYVLLLIYLTLLRITVWIWDAPFTKEPISSISFQRGIERGNFTPFYSINYYLISQQEPLAVGVINVFGNVLLFIPFGFMLPFIWKKLRSIKKSLLVVLIASSFLEFSQLALATGWFDVDDILLNTLGGSIGYAFFVVVSKSRFTNSLFS